MIDFNDDLLKEAVKCVKCGACLSVCPVYRELCEESNSPRGRAALAEDVGFDNLEFTPKLKDIFNKCLACENCEAVCTKEVPIAKIVYEIRARLYEKKHYDTVLHSLIKLMYSSPHAFTMILKNAALLKPLLFEELKNLDLLKPRVNLPFLSKSRTVPKLKSKFFLENDFKETTSRAHISIFTGCVFNFIYPNIAMDSYDILKNLGAEVHVCREQICCGFPAMGIGDFHGLKKLVEKNIEILDRTHPDKIVVLCSSCSLMLKKYYPMIFENEEDFVRDKVRKFADKIVDYAVYLNDHAGGLDKILSVKEKTAVTYHMPCHLAKGLKAGRVIRDIFDGRENVEIIEPSDPDACCGFGGVFNYKHPELSMKINDRRVKDLMETKATTILTSCSGCIMQLKEGLLRNKSDAQVLHISEFITKHSK